MQAGCNGTIGQTLSDGRLRLAAARTERTKGSGTALSGEETNGVFRSLKGIKAHGRIGHVFTGNGGACYGLVSGVRP